jgi:hypothetical protein
MSLLPDINGKSIVNSKGAYERYHIETEEATDIVRWPSRFKVKVRRTGLAKLLLSEVRHYGLNTDVLLSRPCMYGVFSGPVGGFAPREELCVGCLRCTTEFPEFVRVEHNPERQKLGDSYFHFGHVDTASYEASSGLVPVKGAGYRGKFGGQNWDGMWTDMSEIVRPTRDGIHGREFISTAVDIGYTPNFLIFDEAGKSVGAEPKGIKLPLPMLYDLPPSQHANEKIFRIAAGAAQAVGSLAVIPFRWAESLSDLAEAMIVHVDVADREVLTELSFAPAAVEMDRWDANLLAAIQSQWPETVVILRAAFDDPNLLSYFEQGVHVFHLIANYHGRSKDGTFVLDLIRAAHARFVEAGVRQEISLIGSGGMIAAEHVPKALICGLDAVALDTPVMVALQARFNGDCVDRDTSDFGLSDKISAEWGIQRLQNLTGSWRDQLLEIMGAMGLREVRRLRGEMGRAMFMRTLEKEAFAGIEGYDG